MLGENKSTQRIVRTKRANKSKGFRVSTYLSAQPAFKLAGEGRSARWTLAARRVSRNACNHYSDGQLLPEGVRRAARVNPRRTHQRADPRLQRGQSSPPSIPARCFPGCRGCSRRAARFCSRVVARSQVFRLGRRAATVQPWTSPSSWRKTST